MWPLSPLLSYLDLCFAVCCLFSSAFLFDRCMTAALADPKFAKLMIDVGYLLRIATLSTCLVLFWCISETPFWPCMTAALANLPDWWLTLVTCCTSPHYPLVWLTADINTINYQPSSKRFGSPWTDLLIVKTDVKIELPMLAATYVRWHFKLGPNENLASLARKSANHTGGNAVMRRCWLEKKMSSLAKNCSLQDISYPAWIVRFHQPVECLPSVVFNNNEGIS